MTTTQENHPPEGGLCVIGAGHGRTGLTSLKAALEILYSRPVHNYRDLFGRDDRVQFWLDVMRGEKGSPEDFRRYFADGAFIGAVDAPVFIFWEQLSAAFPKAKVVLSVREPKSWYKSAADTIWLMSSLSPSLGCRIFFNFFFRKLSRMTVGSFNLWANDPHFVGRGGLQDAEECMRKLVEWDETVKQRCPRDKLLVWKATDGWEPLCAFLGKPVPAGVPFPHVNDSRSFRRVVNAFRIIGLAVGVVALPAAVAVLTLFPAGEPPVKLLAERQ